MKSRLRQYPAQAAASLSPTAANAGHTAGDVPLQQTVVTWTTSEIGEGDPLTLNIYGTKGMMTLLRSGFKIKPETMAKPGSKERLPLMDAMEVKGADLNVPHVRNFLDCVKSRQKPNADVEEGIGRR